MSEKIPIMKRFLLSSVYITLLGLSAWNSNAGDLKLIANPSVAAGRISVEEFRRIFLLTDASLNDGTHIEPVLAKGGAVRQTILEYLGRTDHGLQTYYRSLVFTGKASMPKMFESDAEV